MAKQNTAPNTAPIIDRFLGRLSTDERTSDLRHFARPYSVWSSRPLVGLTRRALSQGSLRFVKVFFILCGLLGLCVATSACSSLAKKLIDPPRVSLHSVSLKDIATDGVTVVFGVNVENPNPVAIKVDSVKYNVDLHGKSFKSGEINQIPAVPAKGSSLVEVPIAVRYSEIYSSVLALLRNSASPYRIKGEARVGILKIPFDQVGELKLKP